MPLVIADRVRETTTTSGTGTISLSGPYSGFQAFSVIGNGNTTYYAIIDAQNGAWEVGIGAYTSSGNTLSRATVLASSNAGSLVNFGTGTKDVILTQPARRSVLVQEGGSGLITGVAAFAANGVPYADSTSTLATSSNLTFNGTTLTANALTVTNATTINGGTANGVAYLNGSKVLTTGSALTFDGTNFAVGSNAPGQKFVVNGASGVAMQLENSSDSNRGGRFVASGSAASGTFAVNTTSTGYALTFGIDSVEQVRLTSTGLGIGTSSPNRKLEVGGTSHALMGFNSTSNRRYTIGSDANGFVVYDDTAGAYRTIIDSSGNLGLGVTPSAWNGVFRAIEGGSASAKGCAVIFNNTNQQTMLSANAYFDSSFKYGVNGTAAYYSIEVGAHKWFTAPSGTAGNAISFTQALTLHASGGLSLGNTTDYGAGNLSVTGKAKIITSATINSSTATTVTNQASGAVLLRDNTNGGTALIITDTTGGLVIVSQVGATTYVTTSPASTEIQVTNNAGNIQCLGGSSRNGASIFTTALQLS
jgi:hypothetical protein